MRRRLLLVAPLATPMALAGCGGGGFSVLPNRPAIEIRRFALNPRHPRPAAPSGRQVLLVRALSPAPGLELAGLRRLRADGSLDVGFYEEWIAPPARLAEAALRGWLQSSGRFAAVVAPGSRAEAGLVIEAQLTSLEAVPAAGEARAGIAGVLLRETGLLTSRVATAFEVAGRAPLAANAGAAAEAAAMEAALADAFARLEAAIAPFAGVSQV